MVEWNKFVEHIEWIGQEGVDASSTSVKTNKTTGYRPAPTGFLPPPHPGPLSMEEAHSPWFPQNNLPDLVAHILHKTKAKFTPHNRNGVDADNVRECRQCRIWCNTTGDNKSKSWRTVAGNRQKLCHLSFRQRSFQAFHLLDVQQKLKRGNMPIACSPPGS